MAHAVSHPEVAAVGVLHPAAVAVVGAEGSRVVAEVLVAEEAVAAGNQITIPNHSRGSLYTLIKVHLQYL